MNELSRCRMVTAGGRKRPMAVKLVVKFHRDIIGHEKTFEQHFKMLYPYISPETARVKADSVSTGVL